MNDPKPQMWPQLRLPGLDHILVPLGPDPKPLEVQAPLVLSLRFIIASSIFFLKQHFWLAQILPQSTMI